MLGVKKFSILSIWGAVLSSGSVDLWGNEGVSSKAESLLQNANSIAVYLTNSLLTGLLVSLLLVLVIRLLMRNGIHSVPQRGQALVESLIDTLGGILEPIVGKHLFRSVFPLLLGYFVFILIQNLSGLLPGIGSIGFERDGHCLGIFRPMNADLNATLALALIASLAWTYFCVRCVGISGLCGHIFGNKADKKEVHRIVYLLLFFVFFGVGFVECLSIVFRIVSLSFRLYGNVFGGENLLHNMYAMSEFLTSGGLAQTDFYALLHSFSVSLAVLLHWGIRLLGYFLPLPFYFLEFLIGLVQAFVFTLLVAVYIGLICNHDEEELMRKV
ncbi:MAG: F0F1 ATP synthase subunit A [Puniceicoccales bacterium]|jgi:F-type H+-transporting ATPase subunit a|nr:F0F1 ATP synthase subunit A [Puniceicoccales bacterium]